ncbi:MAG: sulfatase-like hydrolase/transferase, partial [Actinobacteria bacterium]|nr:sulfatase-like hydrolase/transferase [Actinomycetota bacterium]
ARQQIDAKRYPNFAALARGSTWYRRATTASDITTSAVPAILTGKLPAPGTPPTASEQPRNLFALLRESHRIRATETFTSMCPAGPCGGTGLSALPRRTLALVGDGLEVAAHAAVPPDLEHRLGGLEQGVKLDDPAASLRRFIGDIRHTDRPELHYLHVLLPHYPWIRLPSGRVYERAAPLDLPRGFQAGPVQRWDPDPSLVRQGWHRHLLQVAYLDRMVGRLLRRLRAVGMYDRSLVVATSDHGVSFVPGEQMRDVTPRNAHDIAFVPLFIKAPGQRRGAVSDGPASTIDVLPSIMEILGGRIPWRTEGRSLIDRHPAPRPPVTVTSSRLPPVTMSARALDRRFRETLVRRIRLFGTGADGPDLVDREHHPEWIGRRIGDRGVSLAGPAAVRIERKEDLRRVSRGSRFAPVLLRGEVRGPAPSSRVLVLALNGHVAAVVPVNPWWRGPPTFSAIFPERLLQEGANSIKAFWTK